MIAKGDADQWATRAYASLVALTYFGFPIISLLPLAMGSASRPVSIIYRAAVGGLSLLFPWLASRAGWRLMNPVAGGAIILLWILLLLRFIWDSNFAPLPLDLPWGETALEIVGIGLIPSIPFVFVPSTSAVVRARVVSLAFGLAAIAALAAGALFSLKSFVHSGRFATDVINPISVGSVGVSVVAFALARPAKVDEGISWARVLHLCGAGVGAVTCILSASKGPLLGLAAVLALYFVYRLVRLSPGRRLLGIALVGSLLTSGAVAIAIFSDRLSSLPIYGRIANASHDPSTVMRLRAWDGALAQFDRSPLFGDNFVELSTRFYPHNALLEAMMTTGIAGLVLIVFVFGLGGLAIFRLGLSFPVAGWLAMLFVQRLVASMVSGGLYLNATLWAALLMLLAFAAGPGAVRKIGSSSSVSSGPT